MIWRGAGMGSLSLALSLSHTHIHAHRRTQTPVRRAQPGTYMIHVSALSALHAWTGRIPLSTQWHTYGCVHERYLFSYDAHRHDRSAHFSGFDGDCACLCPSGFHGSLEHSSSSLHTPPPTSPTLHLRVLRLALPILDSLSLVSRSHHHHHRSGCVCVCVCACEEAPLSRAAWADPMDSNASMGVHQLVVGRCGLDTL